MCGIVGIAGDISVGQISGVFRDMLDVSQLRGRDSTGVIKVAADCESYTSAKLVGPPAFLCDTRMYEKRIEQGGAASVLVGHTRAKTMGDVSNRNAHPFDFPDQGIIGVHNGTLRNHYNLEGRVHTETDSESMYRFLSRNGPEETFSRLEGAWACVWWNQDEQTLNFIRNKERPLWFTWSKDFRQLFWASEPWMLSAASRKIELWTPEKEHDSKLMQLPEDTLWSWQIDTRAKAGEKVMTMRQPKKIVAKPVHVPVTGRYHQQGGAPFRGHQPGWDYDKETGAFVRPTEPAEKGGSVPNPFQAALDEIRDKLDDSLPPSLTSSEAKEPVSSPGGSPNTSIANVEFLKHSPGTTGSSTEQNATKSSPRNILSVPARNSKTSPSSNNVVPLNQRGKLGGTQQTKGCNPPLAKAAVSYRYVAGIPFVTDNDTGKEYGEQEFLKATGGTCSFCKTKIKSVMQVGSIISSSLFLCAECVKEPHEAEPDLLAMNIRQ